jgi:hypothetical protein
MQSKRQFKKQQIYSKRISLPAKTITPPNSQKSTQIVLLALVEFDNRAHHYQNADSMRMADNAIAVIQDQKT